MHPELIKMPYSIDKFRSKYMHLHELWGYRYNANPNYENLTRGDLRSFQHLTDFFMRFLAQGYSTFADVETMFGVDSFYNEGSDFNVTNQALEDYCHRCGPYFRDQRYTCKNALKYLVKCPPSKLRCYLIISLRWMRVVRVYTKKKRAKIKSFTRDIRATAIRECEMYALQAHNFILDANTVQKAIEELEEFE